MFLAPFSPYLWSIILSVQTLIKCPFFKVGNMQDFFRNCTHILTRTQEEKFEDMFLVKIASKGTSLSEKWGPYNCANANAKRRLCDWCLY